MSKQKRSKKLRRRDIRKTRKLKKKSTKQDEKSEGVFKKHNFKFS